MRFVVLVLVVACSQPHVPREQLFEPPVPTFRLPRHFTPQRYAAHLALDPSKPTFTGSIEITGTLDRPSAAIWLNARELTITTATVNGAPAVFSTAANYLSLRGTFPKGPVRIAIAYAGKVRPGVRGLFANEYGGDKYLYTYFEPLNARLVFPCIDEIDRKTPWQLTIDVPPGNVAVSNTPATVEGTRYSFAWTKPLPSYLVAFGVGPFVFVDAGKAKRSGAPLRIVTPRGTEARTAISAKLLPRIVDHLETFFDIPLPYPKLDILVAPDMAGGAMEHAGLITEDGEHVLVDEHTPLVQRRVGMLTIAHETAHQWLGDYVTPTWFEDTWLKEGAATWTEHKTSAALEPSWHDERARVTRRNAAMDSDMLATARRIRQPIVASTDIAAAFDGVTYHKGAAILQVFERYVGEATFLQALTAYLNAHAHGSATLTDFVGALERASGKPLAAAMSTFLDQPGVPELTVKLDCRAAPKLVVTQRRYLPAGAAAATPTASWKVPACFAFEQGGKRVEHCALVTQGAVADGMLKTQPAGAELALPAMHCPAWVMTNAGGLGYYYSALSAADAETLRDKAWAFLDPTEQRAVFEDVRAQVAIGKLPVALLMSFVPKLRALGDRFATSDVLGDRWSGEYDGGGFGLPMGLEGAIPDDLADRYMAWVRAQYGDAARAVGFVASARDNVDEEVTRRTLIRTAAWAGDREVAKQAVALAKKYRELPPSTRDLVLPIAANADPEIAAQLVRDVLVEPDRAARLGLLHALGSVEDPKRAEAIYALAFDPKLTPEDVLMGLFNAQRNRAAAATFGAWIRPNIARFVERFPKGDGSFAIYVVYAMSICDAKQRDATVKVMRDVFGKIPNATRLLAQRIEAIDQCIAQRALVEPSMREWLRTAR